MFNLVNDVKAGQQIFVHECVLCGMKTNHKMNDRVQQSFKFQSEIKIVLGLFVIPDKLHNFPRQTG